MTSHVLSLILTVAVALCCAGKLVHYSFVLFFPMYLLGRAGFPRRLQTQPRPDCILECLIAGIRAVWCFWLPMELVGGCFLASTFAVRSVACLLGATVIASG